MSNELMPFCVPSETTDGQPNADDDLCWPVFLSSPNQPHSVPQARPNSVGYVVGMKIAREVARMATCAMMSFEPLTPGGAPVVYQEKMRFDDPAFAMYFVAPWLAQIKSFKTQLPCPSVRLRRSIHVVPPVWTTEPYGEEALAFWLAKRA